MGSLTTSSTAGADSALSLYHALKRGAEVDSQLGRALKRGLGVLTNALRLYGADIVCSFNGGKDAVVILHLMRAAIAGYNEQAGKSVQLRVIFFETEDEFPEVDAFVRDTIERYNLLRTSYAGVGFAQGLRECIAEHGSKAFVLGTRNGDPNAKGQEDFAPSSDWMPPFMRVNPILHWDYSDVWAFLREYELPYCTLYADVYTSLGKMSLTLRNPALLRSDGSYSPAWELVDGARERDGRVPRALAQTYSHAKRATPHPRARACALGCAFACVCVCARAPAHVRACAHARAPAPARATACASPCAFAYSRSCLLVRACARTCV